MSFDGGQDGLPFVPVQYKDVMSFAIEVVNSQSGAVNITNITRRKSGHYKFTKQPKLCLQNVSCLARLLLLKDKERKTKYKRQ